jgi:tRNA threonylcarbamoyladenosine biosynthesis protein TsaB
MTILALEFSSAQRSVAVARVGNPQAIAETVETGAGGTHAFEMIAAALREAGLDRKQIELIVIGLGPGSYTGIRVAISIAQGWQLACGVRLLGASSAECLAAQAQAENIFGRVNVIVDAQRNEVCLASYEISPDGWKEVEPLQIADLARIQSRGDASEIWVGPEATRWRPKGKILFPSAAILARLATGRKDFASGDRLTPIYLRETQFIKVSRPRPVVF